MPITVERGFFESKDQVLDDIKADDFWPTTFVSDPSPGLETHFHDDEVHAYVMSGTTWFLDADSGERVEVGPGDKVVIPSGTLHAEGEVVDRVTYIIGLPAPRGRREFLAMRNEGS